MRKSVSFLLSVLAIIALPATAGSANASERSGDDALNNVGKSGRQAVRKALCSYLERRWTVERLSLYCRPETRQMPAIQSLSFKPNVLCGDLFGKKAVACGKVTFCAEIEGDKIARYEINVVDSGCWRISEDYDGTGPLSEKELGKMIVYRILKQALAAYAIVHKRDKTEMEKVSQLYLKSADDFQNFVGTDFTFTGTLYSGKQLSALVDDKYNVKSLTVDGALDPLFTRALKEANRNIDFVW